MASAPAIPLSRLTNTQYDNALSDVLGVDGRPSAEFPDLPPDDTRADSYPLLKAYWAGAEQAAGRAFAPGGRFEKSCVESAAADPTCARTFVATQGRLLFRRTPTAADVEALMAVFQASVALGYREALKRTLTTMLLSPSFLYRVELPRGRSGAVPLAPEEVATRMAFLAWNSVPSGELLDLAAQGGLATPGQRVAELDKMLGTDKGKRMARDFAAGWLHSRGVLEVKKETKGFDDAVARALAAETEDFVSAVLLDPSGGSFAELFTADYSLVTDKLKTLYGLTVTSKTPVRTSMPQGQRSGLLTHGSILSVQATAVDASPIKRGVFVFERLLCETPPPVPENVPPLPGTDSAGKTITQRERLQLHRDNPACRGCHAAFDGFGLALEQYDLIGRYVPTEAGKALTGDGEVSSLDGQTAKFKGAVELGKLLASSKQARRCFAQRVLESATGHEPTVDERPLLQTVGARIAETGNLQQVFRDLVADESFARRPFGGK